MFSSTTWPCKSVLMGHNFPLTASLIASLNSGYDCADLYRFHIYFHIYLLNLCLILLYLHLFSVMHWKRDKIPIWILMLSLLCSKIMIMFFGDG